MEQGLEREVRRRAGGRCEYCLLAEAAVPEPFQIDHIVARKHGGLTIAKNLALSCVHCNRHKGPNVAGVDGESGRIVPLFNPRQDVWAEHFVWHGAMLVGVTPAARATVDVLKMNAPSMVRLRSLLLAAGEFPPV